MQRLICKYMITVLVDEVYIFQSWTKVLYILFIYIFVYSMQGLHGLRAKSLYQYIYLKWQGSLLLTDKLDCAVQQCCQSNVKLKLQ